MGRAERIIPGIWRLRIPLPWMGVPHVNAYALSAGDGIVLVDTGTAVDGDPSHLEFALSQMGRSLEDISLVVCTHAHADHYGSAKPVVEASGAPFAIHPAWGHVRRTIENPHAGREEIARQSGVPPAVFEQYEAERGDEAWIAGVVEPDIDLLPGVTIDTDLGRWEVHETPGHAPSHVVLHQPERRLLISGDHLLGRVSIFFDYGNSPDPVGEYLASLDRVEKLDVGLVIAGHGRPFRDPVAKVAATRALVMDGLTRARAALAHGPASAYDLVVRVAGAENVNSTTAPFVLQVALAYLDHLKELGEAVSEPGDDGPIWSLV
jgi:glyoxylase-like metal-dependent hydrolase (beta-lactamase superfamily II)